MFPRGGKTLERRVSVRVEKIRVLGVLFVVDIWTLGKCPWALGKWQKYLPSLFGFSFEANRKQKNKNQISVYNFTK
jgi:hypothetical protein